MGWFGGGFLRTFQYFEPGVVIYAFCDVEEKGKKAIELGRVENKK